MGTYEAEKILLGVRPSVHPYAFHDCVTPRIYWHLKIASQDVFLDRDKRFGAPNEK